MRYLWLTSLLISAGFLNSWSSWAQQPTATPSADAVRPTIPAPVYVLNNRFIVGGLWDVVPTNIAEVMVYKDGGTPSPWRSLMIPHGLVSVTLKKKTRLKAKSLTDIRRWLEVNGPVSFQLEDQPLEDVGLQIVTDAIAGLDVVRPSVGQSTTIINIRLVRTNPRPTHHSPGTIMIRGSAGQ